MTTQDAVKKSYEAQLNDQKLVIQLVKDLPIDTARVLVTYLNFALAGTNSDTSFPAIKNGSNIPVNATVGTFFNMNNSPIPCKLTTKPGIKNGLKKLPKKAIKIITTRPTKTLRVVRYLQANPNADVTDIADEIYTDNIDTIRDRKAVNLLGWLSRRNIIKKLPNNAWKVLVAA